MILLRSLFIFPVRRVAANVLRNDPPPSIAPTILRAVNHSAISIARITFAETKTSKL